MLLWLFFHKRRPLFAEHMVIALYLSCATMTITLAVSTVARLLQIDSMVGGVTGGAIAAFGGVTIRTAYRGPSQWLLGPCLVTIIVANIVIVSMATAMAVNYQAAALT